LLEAAAINKSLTALGQVFRSIAENSPHIPYRNSKLTHVLQDSLGGDSKTCVFVNFSPSESNLAESICTLNFGQFIRRIEFGPLKKNKGILKSASVRDETHGALHNNPAAKS
jgi:kinesin family protein C2/C3